jgi:acylpyruvate hydrolase
MATAFQHLLTAGTKIVAVGRNYAAHAKELGNAVPKVSPPLSLSLNMS